MLICWLKQMQLKMLSRKLQNTGTTESLCCFCSSLTTGPTWTKFGTAIALRKTDLRTNIHLAVFLCCCGSVRESFVKQQKLVKQVKKWTFANGNETNCIGVVFCAEFENEVLAEKIVFTIILGFLRLFCQFRAKNYFAKK